MSFSNPFGSSGDAIKEYVASLIARLDGRDPGKVMQGTPGALRELLSSVSAGDLMTPEAPGKWSAKGVLVHLLDSEVVYGYRMRFIVAQPEQDIAGYDQDQWARALRYEDAPRDLTLDAFGLLRRWNLGWLDSLNDDERARWGNHSERGHESVDHIVKLLAAHDLVHLAQIRRILATVRS